MNSTAWIDSTVPPGSPPSLTTVAVNRLREDIIEGRLAPDQKLRVKLLCERFEINTSAIREALSRLVSEGWVRAEEQRGFYVAPVSTEELLDVTQTRIQLESLALTQAVKSANLAWEGKLVAAFHTLSKIPVPQPSASGEDKREWFNAHRAFHQVLIEGCGSPTLIALCNSLYAKTERYRHLSGTRRPAADRDLESEHRRLLDAALARDADTLIKEISAHFLTTTGQVLANVLERPGKVCQHGAASGSHQSIAKFKADR